MVFESRITLIDEWMKVLAELIQVEISISPQDKLIMHHASNAIKNLSNLRARLSKRVKKQ